MFDGLHDSQAVYSPRALVGEPEPVLDERRAVSPDTVVPILSGGPLSTGKSVYADGNRLRIRISKGVLHDSGPHPKFDVLPPEVVVRRRGQVVRVNTLRITVLWVGRLILPRQRWTDDMKLHI